MTWSAKLAPWLSVADTDRAVDFYKSAFGAVEPERLEGDGVLQVARLGIGEADFWGPVRPRRQPARPRRQPARPQDPDRGRPRRP